MKFHSAVFVLSLFSVSLLSAQEVQRCCGTSNSTFLLGNLSYAKHTQSLYLPSDLNNAQNGTITRLYFRYGTTGEDLGNTLTDLNIRLGQTTATTFAPGNVFFTDLDTVLMSTVTIEPGMAGEWFSFSIAPFTYSMNSTLILDIRIGNSSTLNFGTYGTSNSGRKIYANNFAATTGNPTSSTWQDLGFDLGTTSVTTVQRNNDLQLVPMPGNVQWHLLWADRKMTGASILLFDATGKVLRTDRVASNAGPYTLDMAPFSTGIYLVQLRTVDGEVRTQRFFRP